MAQARGRPRCASQRQGRSNKKAIKAAVRNSPGNGANCTSKRFSTKAFKPSTGSRRPSRNQAGQGVIVAMTRIDQYCSREAGLEAELT